MTDDQSQDNNNEQAPEEETSVVAVKMGDDLIAVIRELVQLSLLTGTNIVDHMRAITCEVDPDTGKLVPTEDYTDAYNEMIESLVKQAEAAKDQLEGVLAPDPNSPPN